MAMTRLILMTWKKVRAAMSGSIVIGILGAVLLQGGNTIHAQVPAPPGPAPALSLEADVSPDELQRLERKRALEEALPKIREAYLRGDYQEVLKAVGEAEKIDANNGSVRFYKEMAKMRLSSGETPTVRSRVIPRTTEEGSVGKSPTGLPSLPGSDAATKVTAPKATDETARDAAPQEGGSQSETVTKPGIVSRILSSKVLLYGGLTVVLLVAAAGIYVKIRSRRQGSQEEEDEEEELPGAPATAPTMGLQAGFGLSGLPRRPDEDTIVDPDDIAQQMADFKPSEQAPTFDIFHSPSDEDGFGGGHTDGVPTVVEEGGVAEDHGRGNLPQFEPSRPAEEAPRPRVESSPEPASAPPSPGAAHAGETVSFDDLGIFLSDEPVKASPEKPVIAQPAKPVSEDRNPVSPAGTFFRDTDGKEKGLGIDSITLSDPELKSAPPPAVSHEPIRLEGIAGNAQAAEKKAVPAPVVEKPAGTIDLEDLLFGDLEATLGSASSPAVPQASSPAPASSPAGLSGFDVSWNKPTPEPPGALDATATGFSETIHSQDTVQISPISIGGSSAPREIEAYKHPNDALDATVGMDERKKEPESAYGTPGKGSAGSQLDERSEKMFREQFDRAMKAFGEKNWKQAVHYLSIAAAIHPENTDVREKLREARDQKRKQEISA